MNITKTLKLFKKHKDDPPKKVASLSEFEGSPTKIIEEMFYTYNRLNHFSKFWERAYNNSHANIKSDMFQYNCSQDGNSCEHCKEYFGKVFHYMDPFWEEFAPPNHLGCRCWVIRFRNEYLREKELTEELDPPQKHPNDLWAFNPGLVEWEDQFRFILERTILS